MSRWAWWRQLVEPTNTPPELYAKTKLVILAALAFFLSSLVHLALLHTFTDTRLTLPQIAALLVLLIGIYGLARWGYYWLSIHFGLYSATVVLLWMAFSDFSDNTLWAVGVVVVLPYLGSILSTMRHTIALVIFQLLCIFIGAALTDKLTRDEQFLAMIFILAVAVPPILVAQYSEWQQALNRMSILRSRDHYQHLFESNLLGVVTHDGRVITLANEAAAHIFGYASAKDMMGVSLRDMIFAEDIPPLRDYAEGLLSGAEGHQTNIRTEFRGVTTDKQVRWLDAYSSLIQTEQASPAILASFVDITDRKAAEQLLQKRQAFDQLISAVSTQFISTDSDQLPQQFQSTVQAMGEFAQADYAFIFLLEEKNVPVNTVYEWYRDNQPIPVGFPLDSFGWGIRILHTADDGFATEAAIPNQGTYIENQIEYMGELIGVVGIYAAQDNHPWGEEIPTMLQIMSEIFANTMTRQRTENNLYYHLDLDRIITNVSTRFINLPIDGIDAGIEEALETVGRFVDADHCYVFMYQDDQRYADNTHEWTREGIAPQLHLYQNMPIADFPWTSQRLKQRQPAYIPSVHNLSESIPDRQLLLAQGIYSLLEVPMIYQGKLIGYVGLDTIEREYVWSDDVISLLRIMGEIFATALVRKQSQLDLHHRTHILEVLNQVGEVVSSILEVEPLLDRISRLICEALDATSVYISDWNIQEGTTTVLGEYVSPTATTSERRSDRGKTYPFSRTDYEATARAQSTGEVLWHLHVDDPNLPTPDRQHMLEYDARSILRGLLMGDGVLNGQIEIWESRHKRVFSRQEQEMVRAVAAQASAALKRATLYRALQESEQRNSAILDAVPDLIFRQNAEGRYLEVKTSDPNELVEAPDQITGKLPEDLLPRELAQQVHDQITAALKHKSVRVFEYELQVGQEQEIQYFEARIIPNNEQEVLTFIRNISERKAAQSRELDLELERERVRILENFISDASHDLRTPISNLKSRIYLLRRAKSEDSRQRQVNVMEDEIVRLERLIEDLLTMSQLERHEAEPVSLNIGRIIEEQVEANELLIARKNLQVILDIHDNTPRVEGDPVQISRVIANLLSNAIHYTIQGTVTLRTRADKNGLRLDVIDTGIGISEDEQLYIFDRFYRADKARSTDTGGTGLGLAIVKKIVELHHGSITVDSEPEKGTTFTVWLPTQQPLVAL